MCTKPNIYIINTIDTSLFINAIKNHAMPSIPDDINAGLNRAAWDGDYTTVVALLKRGASPRWHNTFGNCAINLAAAQGHIDILQHFISRGVRIKVKDKDGWTPLIWASVKGHLPVVSLLLSHDGANVHDVDNGIGWTAVMFASSRGHDAIVEALLNNGANLTGKTSLGWSPIVLASRDGKLNVIDLLLLRGANFRDKNIDGKTCAQFAIEGGHIDIYERLRRWTCFMAIICLEELVVFYALDCFFIVDLSGFIDGSFLC